MAGRYDSKGKYYVVRFINGEEYEYKDATKAINKAAHDKLAQVWVYQKGGHPYRIL